MNDKKHAKTTAPFLPSAATHIVQHKGALTPLLLKAAENFFTMPPQSFLMRVIVFILRQADTLTMHIQ